jgi:hypothetical protein
MASPCSTAKAASTSGSSSGGPPAIDLPCSVPGLAQVDLVRGATADESAAPTLVIEVPHGADQLTHYTHTARQLRGPMPEGLFDWFCVNTDVGAWDLGGAVAEAYVRHRPAESALVVRALVPRTFIDCNRILQKPDARPLSEGGLTPGLPPYITDFGDQALLQALHARYVAVAEAAFEVVCGRGGRGLHCHTYAPRSVSIDRVDADIVKNIRAAWEPDVAETWPLRAEVDLISRDENGERLCIEGAVEDLLAAYTALGVQAVEGKAYFLHPSTRAATLSQRYPGQTLGVEVRRDKVVDAWLPFSVMQPNPTAIARFAQPLADMLAARPG